MAKERFFFISPTNFYYRIMGAIDKLNLSFNSIHCPIGNLKF
ncbi:hypothetical protein LEP1GSC203_1198 [Leptospira terpstrae serovar Hualin str. LT 11-33 = ATCC 700639]|uniref:Uncharacterized protein n=1 Tax=Leptospira terpstrae serovar Hualin str. LT 11-33 = ATCC 700639 TaxID=1257025 RepID=N1VWX6_9LEPT|nr:hypothetical protein LEP1GSC203_1198 [Leptospira terpstrae serovar Hualin str. LT 11-33 = ATCC 700639]